MKRKFVSVVLIWVLLFIGGCASFQFNSIEPITPKPQWKYLQSFTLAGGSSMHPMASPPVIKFSQPTFEWNEQVAGPSEKNETKYDFIIWDCIGCNLKRTDMTPDSNTAGKVVYYRENLNSNKHIGALST